jgi:hypothetical protein
MATELICPTCLHPWLRHTAGGMCAGEPPDGSECYCVRLFPDPRVKPDKCRNCGAHWSMIGFDLGEFYEITALHSARPSS